MVNYSLPLILRFTNRVSLSLSHLFIKPFAFDRFDLLRFDLVRSHRIVWPQLQPLSNPKPYYRKRILSHRWHLFLRF